jgi:lysyl-tRNA synthetase class 1
VRTKQIPPHLSDEDEQRLQQRVAHVQYWLDNFAPAAVKFNIKKKLPQVLLTSEEKLLLSRLKEIIPDIAWDAEAIHNAIYTISEKEQLPVKTAFKALYQVLLGQEQGPRAGYFLSNLDKQFVVKRLIEAIK